MARPSVTLKLATSMDGRIALANGVSQWITSSDSRARVHEMRASHDAVLAGIGTVLADDPMLTARTVPLPKQQPMRIVADSHGRTPIGCRLVTSSGLGRVIVATANPSPAKVTALEGAGVELWKCGGVDGRVSPERLLDQAAISGAEKVFLEGGGQLAASFVLANLVDTIAWFRAPILIGGDGLPALSALGLTKMEQAKVWQSRSIERIGSDTLEIFDRA